MAHGLVEDKEWLASAAKPPISGSDVLARFARGEQAHHPVSGGRLKAVGRMLKPGSTIVYIECEIFDSDENRVAKASANLMTLKGQGVAIPGDQG